MRELDKIMRKLRRQKLDEPVIFDLPEISTMQLNEKQSSLTPLSLEDLPEIENPFRSTAAEVGLDAVASLNNIGAQVTGADLMAGVTVPNTGELPFDQLKNNQQKIAKGQGIFKDDITFGG